MRRLISFFFLLAIAGPLSAEPASLWMHNGSIVALYAQGHHRAFRYRSPRKGLRQSGVRTGTLLFDGVRSGDGYVGMAYVFSRRCGAVPYPVSGGPSADEHRLVLIGVAPAGFDSACRITRYRNDVLQFDLKTVLIPPAPPPEAPVVAHAQPPPRVTYVPSPPPRTIARIETSSPRAAANRSPSSPSKTILGRTVFLLGCLMALGLVSYLVSAHDQPAVASARSPPSKAKSPHSHSTEPSQPTKSKPAMTLDASSDPERDTHHGPTAHTTFDKIVLKLRRSQRSGALGGKPIFVLDARVDVPPDDRDLIAKYRLGGITVYDSKARKQHAETAYGHFTEAGMPVGAGRSLWRSARGIASAAMMALSLRVTINKLISGQHIECKDLDELLGAEAAMVEACKNLRTYLDTARTFDGREELIEF